MPTAYVGLGSNLGDRERNLREAVRRLDEIEGVEVVSVSTFRNTSPVGGPPQGDFLNGAVAIETDLSAVELLDALLGIENDMGRKREQRWGPRIIDLDLLMYDSVCVEGERLTLPHPGLHERAFVLEPLAEIAPDARHAASGRTVVGMLEELKKRRRHE